MSCFLGIEVILAGLIDLVIAATAKGVVVRSEGVKATREEKATALQEQLNELEGMGYQVEKTEQVKDSTGNEVADVDLVIHTKDGYSLGLKRDKHGAYKLVARWSSTQPLVERASEEVKKLENQIKQRYAYEKVKREVAKQGFVVAKEEVMPDNSIKILVRKWT